MFTILTGSQFGDEGKGKVVDLLAENYDIVVRFQGGDNAGHTVIVGDKTYKLHLTPSGVIFGARLLIGPGVVLNPKVLMSEIEDLALMANGAVGTVYSGVDLIETVEGLAVLEVNGTPSGRGVFQAWGIDAGEMIAAHILERLKGSG